MIDFDSRLDMSPVGTRWFKFYILIALVLQMIFLGANIYASYEDFEFVFSGGLNNTPALFNFLIIVYLLLPIVTLVLVVMARIKCKKFEMQGYFFLQLSIWLGVSSGFAYSLIMNYTEIFINANSEFVTGLFFGLLISVIPNSLSSYYFAKRKFLFTGINYKNILADFHQAAVEDIQPIMQDLNDGRSIRTVERKVMQANSPAKVKPVKVGKPKS